MWFWYQPLAPSLWRNWVGILKNWPSSEYAGARNHFCSFMGQSVKNILLGACYIAGTNLRAGGTPVKQETKFRPSQNFCSGDSRESSK